MKEEASVKESLKTSDKADGKKEKGKDKGIALRDTGYIPVVTLHHTVGLRNSYFITMERLQIIFLFTHHVRTTRKGNVFSRVCMSVYSQGGGQVHGLEGGGGRVRSMVRGMGCQIHDQGIGSMVLRKGQIHGQG